MRERCSSRPARSDLARLFSTALLGPALAAAEPASSPSSPDDVVQVVVTAQKRSESLRDVPISVSALTDRQVETLQVATVEDLTRNVPNVSFSTQAGPGLGTIEIRGVSSQAGSATVSLYLDEVSLTTRNIYSMGTAEPRFFDIAGIEVLRGPQGTLYGASALGGTIRILGRQPDPREFAASARTSVSDTAHGGANWMTEAVVNVPLAKDSVALRIGVQAGRDSGYIDQVVPATGRLLARGIDAVRWHVAKAALKAEIAPGWSLVPALFAQQTDTADDDAAYLATLDGIALPRFETSKLVREPGHDRLFVPSATLTGATALGDFTGVLGSYQRRFNRVQDGTLENSVAMASEITDPALATLVARLPAPIALTNRIDQTSLELRMTSRPLAEGAERRFDWIAGVFLLDAATQIVDNEPIPGVTRLFADHGQDIDDPADLAGSFPGAVVGDSVYYSARHYHDRQASAFGELTWHARPGISATAGLRVLRGTQHFTREGDFYFNGGPAVTTGIDTEATATTPSLKIAAALDPGTSVYANLSKGFRFGAANRPVPLTPQVLADLQALGLPDALPATFAPDSLWSYEVGSRHILWGGRASLNLAAFVLDWKNIQQDIVLPTSGFEFETNVGRARSMGLEAEASARANANLTLRATAGLTHAVFTQDIPALGTDDQGGYNVRKGSLVQGVPRASASLGFDEHWAASALVNAFIRGNAQWVGKSRGSPFRSDGDYDRPSYFTVDASAGFDTGRWEVTAFVKNANNNHAVIQRPDIQVVSQAYYLRPRTAGVRLNYEFD